MELHWSDVQRIAEEPQKSNEQILEAILQAWLNERD